MKVRRGFVTNSSSSSFLIAASGGDLRVSLRIEVDLKDLVNKKAASEEAAVDLMEYKEYTASTKAAILDAIREGKTVYEVSVASDGEPEESLIYDLLERGEDVKEILFPEGSDIEVIQEDYEW